MNCYPSSSMHRFLSNLPDNSKKVVIPQAVSKNTSTARQQRDEPKEKEYWVRNKGNILHQKQGEGVLLVENPRQNGTLCQLKGTHL